MIILIVCKKRNRSRNRGAVINTANPPIYVTSGANNNVSQMQQGPPPPYNPNYQLQYPVTTVQFVQAPPNNNYNNQGYPSQTFHLPPSAPTMTR